MRKLIYPVSLVVLLVTLAIACQKSSSNVASSDANALTQEEKALVASAGFNSNWVEKNADGNYLIEGDILLSRAQLQEMSGAAPSNNFIIADEEHYRTFNLVTTPNTGSRVITVRLTSGFPAHYSTGLDQALARYNSIAGLKITFQRVTTGGDIVITAANLGTSGGGCILGQASGFPTSSGNPSSGFTLSNSSCATTYLNTADKADEVMAHEIGHCIGFRHTDYKKRASCGPGAGEQAGSIGAVHIDGTPTNVNGSYNSWMMACVNNSPSFSADDIIALTTVY
ncbi:MAG: M57 family metalloprotease [Bacteroidota bacterium]